MQESLMVELKDVFVPGGMPGYTYMERKEGNDSDAKTLEEKLSSAAQRLRKFISVAGPTKSGKTLLVRKVMPKTKAIWIEGGHIAAAKDFWQELSSKLEIPTAVKKTKSIGEETSFETDDAASFKPAGMGVEIKNRSIDKNNNNVAETNEFPLAATQTIVDELLESNKVLVIDDFHYIPADAQTAIIRGLKQSVFDGQTVVLILIPHRMHQAAKAEMDVDGRTHTIKIPDWSGLSP